MRKLNCNVTAGAVPIAQGEADDHSLVPMAWRPDQDNPSRGSFEMADCDIPNGGMSVTVLATGFQPFVTRAIIPLPGQQEEGPSLNLEPVAPFPEPPTRAEAITIRGMGFQGRYYYSNAYGAEYQRRYGGNGQIPYYAAALQDFWVAGDGIQMLDQLAADGDSHVMIYCRPEPGGYGSPGQPYGDAQLIPAFDCWANMGVYKEIVDTIIKRGKLPLFVLYGEDDWGRDWLKANFQSWDAQMREGYDRLAYGPVLVAFDGVWPATWTVDEMKEMIPWMRSVLGDIGYLAFMFGGQNGVAYMWVEDDQDYTKPWMDGLDIVMQTTGPGEAECPSLANKARYMVPNPNYTGCQPDKPSRFILFPNSRGERRWLMGEYATYETVRDPWQQWKPWIDAAVQRQKDLNCQAWG